MTDSRARLVHKGTPVTAGVPVGRPRPADGRIDLTLTCAVCDREVPVAVLSAPTARRGRVRTALRCLAGFVAAIAGGIIALTAGATPVGIILLIVGLLLIIVLIERVATMDDGVRVLERPRRHVLDRPGWSGFDDGTPAEAS